MPKSDCNKKRLTKSHKTPQSFEGPITDRTKVKSPKTGKLITIATAVRQGFMNEIVRDGFKGWEWADRAFPQETQREKEERLESHRLTKFLIEDNHDLPPLWDLGAIIKKEDGRLRLWLEIREDTTWKGVEEGLKYLKEWKRRLIKKLVRERDPQPHPIPVILAQLKKATGKTKHSSVGEQINSWITERLRTWEKGDGLTRALIDAEIFGVLRLFGLEDAAIHDILKTASDRIPRGLDPWERDAAPVTKEALKSISRKWKKRSTYSA